MIQQDSIHIDVPVANVQTKPQTPYQVLRLLPKDATPAQQDSAIQAWLEPVTIHYSEQPDTLHLPGEDIPRDLRAVNIPIYYRENFFSENSFYHLELGSEGYGIAGTPIPREVVHDDIITGIIILCFLTISFVLSRISGFITRQIKDFIYTPQEIHTATRTTYEMRMQIVLLCITCIIIAILCYLYTVIFIADTFTLSSDYILLGIFTGAIIGYFGLRFLLYAIVNNTFFSPKQNEKFLTNLLFLSILEGIVLFPAVIFLIFLDFSIENIILYTATVLILVKLLTIYKSHIIFFRQKKDFLQNILYFCALEIIPLFMLYGGLSVIVDILKVNF